MVVILFLFFYNSFFGFLKAQPIRRSISTKENVISKEQCYVGEDFGIQLNPTSMFNADSSVTLGKIEIPTFLSLHPSSFKEVATIESDSCQYTNTFDLDDNMLYRICRNSTSYTYEIVDISDFNNPILKKTALVSSPNKREFKLRVIGDVIYSLANSEGFYALKKEDLSLIGVYQEPTYYDTRSTILIDYYERGIKYAMLPYHNLRLNQYPTERKLVFSQYTRNVYFTQQSQTTPFQYGECPTAISVSQEKVIAFVAYGKTNSEGEISYTYSGIHFVDPVAKSILNTYPTNNGYVISMKAVGNLLFCLKIHKISDEYSNRFFLLNVTNILQPKLIFEHIFTAEECTPGTNYELIISEKMDYAYISRNKKFITFDIGDFNNPRIINNNNTIGGKDVQIRGDFIFYTDNKLRILEHSEKIIKGTCVPGIHTISVEGCNAEDECITHSFKFYGLCRNLNCENGYPTESCSECICPDGYFGDHCEFWKCDNFMNVDETNVCKGFGTCVEPEKCFCGNISSSENWVYDDLCNKKCKDGTIMLDGNCQDSVTIIGITISIVGVIGCILICVVVLVIVFLIVLIQLRKRAKRFDHIDGIDMIVKEAELEQKELKNVPKIKTGKKNYLIEFKDIELKKVIGQGGSQTTVFKALWRGDIVAYKSFTQGLLAETENQYNDFEKEVKACTSLRHPSILQFFGAVVNPPKVGLVMEFAENGDIPSFFGFYREKNQQSYPIKEKIRIIKEIASGMDYLHSKSFIHRDLKPENVLIDENEKSKIMDFGLTKLKERSDQTMTKMCGTLFYMAPEVISSKGSYGNKCDVYSWAVLSLVVISDNYKPYGEISQNKILSSISTDPNFRPEIDESEFKGIEFLIPIIKKNWSFSADERNSFAEIKKILKKHSFTD